jgi:hypothetical protein
MMIALSSEDCSSAESALGEGALRCITSLKLPSVALYVIECTFLGIFDSFRAHHLFDHLPGCGFQGVP